MRHVLVFWLSFFCVQLASQVVWTEPAFPTQEDDIILYYDATQGNAGLKDFTGDVYAHMGLITNNSNSSTDWKYVVGTWGTADSEVLMTREGPNLYSKSYNITDFHGLPVGEVVERLAFVFRSADGSQAGRAADGSDIYLDVFLPSDGLLATLNSPQDNTVLYEDESLVIDLLVNKVAEVIITDNGSEIYRQTTEQVEFIIDDLEVGSQSILITISEGQESLEILRSYFVLERDDALVPRPSDITPYGLSYLDQSYGISLVAPGKDHVFVLCPANNFQVDLDFKMNRDVDGNTFWIELPKETFDNGEHLYQFYVDGKIKIADPYSEIVLDPWNDDGVLERDLYPAYPDAYTTGLVTAFAPEDEPFVWQATDYVRPAKEKLVIYEILMRDFLDDKRYTSLLDTISYLSDLGINAIELMPVQEFEGNNSWGYNPSFHNAIDKYYGSKEQLQQVIDKCHEHGIAVIIDVVFNHAFSQSPFCQLYWDATNFRPSEDNPWLNVFARHPFNVGYDFNHESQFTKAWVKEVLQTMIHDLNVDGFRFDLSKGLTQFNSGGNSGLMSRYDQTRIDIITDYANHIWSFDDGLYVILEHFADSDEEKELASKGMLLWTNTTFQFAEAAMGYDSDLTSASYKSRGFAEPSLIAYMESHDEERMGYKIKTWGNSSADYNTKEPWTFSERIVATSAVYLSIPGPKMLWQFGELGYDESINRCENGTVDDDCRLSPKPIRWEDLDLAYLRNIRDKVAAILYLRNNSEAFHTANFSFQEDDYFKRIKLNGSDMNVITVANFDMSTMVVSPQFQHTGVWYDYLTGDSIEVTDVNMSLDLKPGHFRIYLDKQITPPNGFLSSAEELTYKEVRVFPNPVVAGESFFFVMQGESKVSVFDAMGKTVSAQILVSDGVAEISISEDLQSGIYYLRVESEGLVRTAKFKVINP